MEEFRSLTGNTFRGIVHPEDLENVEKSIWKQISESRHDLDYVEYRIIQKSGKIRWIEDYGHLLSEYVETWVHKEDRAMVADALAPERIRQRLLDNRTFYINIRTIEDDELQYLQFCIAGVGTENHFSRIVLGTKRVDDEIRHEMKQKKIFEDALNQARLANTPKSTFLSNMSHDMRTPLNAITGYTTLVRNYIHDTEKVTQILIYLCGNAVKYTGNKGHVLLTITEEEDAAAEYALYRFAVKDDGIGIDEKYLERIFEPFERVSNTTFCGVYGTGLGLTLARNLAEMMSGQIGAVSTPGLGSEFTLTPRLCLQQKQEIGLSIDTAGNGQEAVDKIVSSPSGAYALILMDIQMPVMDGHTATHAIRNLSDPVRAHIPIIALSANAFDENRRKSMESGMNAHMAKPLDMTALLELIASIILEIR